MNNPELLVVSVLRALIEVALLSLIGQGVLALLAGRGRATNPVYRMFQVITEPAIKTVRFIAPRLIGDKHLPILTFLLLLVLWFILAYVKRIIAF